MKTSVVFEKKLIITNNIYKYLPTWCVRKPAEEKQVNIIFRYDDFSALSPTDIELIIIDEFCKRQINLTIGVIPYVCAGNVRDPSPSDNIPLTLGKSDILKTGFKTGFLEIALHGCSHQTINSVNMTEFLGLDYESQIEKLGKGKNLLEDIIDAPVNIFIPPWNSYDLTTLHALDKLEFSTISADESDREADSKSKLNFLPASCGLGVLQYAIEIARRSPDVQPVIVVLFHSYDFLEVNKKKGFLTHLEFSNILNWIKDQNNVRVLSIYQATKVINNLNVNRYLLTKRYFSLSNLLPYRIRPLDSIMYMESPDLPKILLMVVCFYFMIAGLGAAILFLVGNLCFPKTRLIINIATYSSIVISPITIICMFHHLQLDTRIRGMMVVTSILGASIGLCISFFQS